MFSNILPPLFGAVIGYITNDIAIRMLFRPHTAKYIMGMHIPFTPGIIPKEKERIAKALGVSISENLMNKEVLEQTLLSQELIDKIENTFDTFCKEQQHNEESLRDFITHYISTEELAEIVHSARGNIEALIVRSLATCSMGEKIAQVAVDHAVQKISGGLLGVFGADKLLEPVASFAKSMLAREIDNILCNNSTELVHTLVGQQGDKFMDIPMQHFFVGHEEEVGTMKTTLVNFYRSLITERLPKILSAINISQMIEKRINEMDMNELEPILLQVMDKELKAIVWFGAGLGALIGCVNLFVSIL